MTTATKTQKQVQVINRYEFKDRNLVVYEVRSSNGNDKYRTTFLDGKVTGCSCPSYKPCYHMTQLQARENSRKAAKDDLRFSPWHGSNRDGEPLSREAYQDLFDPCTVPGMY